MAGMRGLAIPPFRGRLQCAARWNVELPRRRKNHSTHRKIMATNAIDLTLRPPRSPRVRLGGYVILPRMLDKGRAALAGKHGEYHYACPMDERFLSFVGIDPAALKKELAKGKSDSDILKWINAKAKHKRTDAEIAAWSAYAEQRSPADNESRDYFNEILSKAAPHREDISTWFDLLDVDDFVSFGGKG
jgi:hypothetical protein